jgi:hypothetical protein
MPRVRAEGSEGHRVKKRRSIKAIGRKPRTLGWTLLTLGVLVAGVWVWSPDNVVSLNGWSFDARDGTITISWRDSGYDAAVSQISMFPGIRIWRWWDWYINWGNLGAARSGYALIRITPWPLALLLAGVGLAVLPRRIAHAGCCCRCGYDLAGLAANNPCPECGKVTADAAVSTPASGS